MMMKTAAADFLSNKSRSIIMAFPPRKREEKSKLAARKTNKLQFCSSSSTHTVIAAVACSRKLIIPSVVFPNKIPREEEGRR